MTDALNWYGGDVATFGDRLEAARRNANLSQRGVAKHIGIKSSTLKNWEDDVTEPRANKLNTLAGTLNVSLIWLINGEGDGLEASDENSVTDANLDAALIEIRECWLPLIGDVLAVGLGFFRVSLKRSCSNPGGRRQLA